MACLHGDTRFIVTAKQAVGTLYDGGGHLYPQLFRQQLSGVTLARSVRLYDYAMQLLFDSEMAEANYSRRKMFYRHGRFFVLHIFARRNRAVIDRADDDALRRAAIFGDDDDEPVQKAPPRRTRSKAAKSASVE